MESINLLSPPKYVGFGVLYAIWYRKGEDEIVPDIIGSLIAARIGVNSLNVSLCQSPTERFVRLNSMSRGIFFGVINPLSP